VPRHHSAEVRREADELGIAIETLYRWRRQALIVTGQRPGVKSFGADPLTAARRRIPLS
jgi:transposase-like protein